MDFVTVIQNADNNVYRNINLESTNRIEFSIHHKYKKKL
jgi:hypothetical protein